MKNNWGRRGNTFEYFIDDNGKFTWGDSVPDVRGEQILEGNSKQKNGEASKPFKSSKRDKAKEIIDLLIPKDGTRIEARKISEAIEKFGGDISESTLGRARIELGIHVTQEAPGQPAYWYRDVN